MSNSITQENATQEALKILEGAGRRFTEDDVSTLASNLLTLESRGLCRLNIRLMQGGRGILDTFAEHNLGTELVLFHDPTVLIDYEPNDGLQRPPDFRVRIGEATFWIQMKRLSISERDNRRNGVISSINRSLELIQVSLYYWFEFSEEFDETDVPDFIEFVSNLASCCEPEVSYHYPSAEGKRAYIRFLAPQNITLNHLTHGGSNDMDLDFINITGEDAKQIRGSLTNAAGAFEWNCDHQTVNLIVMESDNKYDINIGEAVFGKELWPTSGRDTAWHRDGDGFFNNEEFSGKVAGVIAIRRTAQHLITTYTKTLFINERFQNIMDQIRQLIGIDRVVFFNDYLK